MPEAAVGADERRPTRRNGGRILGFGVFSGRVLRVHECFRGFESFWFKSVLCLSFQMIFCFFFHIYSPLLVYLLIKDFRPNLYLSVVLLSSFRFIIWSLVQPWS